MLGLVIFFSATQLGLHFWPTSSLVYGIRVDYLAPTIYLFDLLLLGYLVARRSDLLRKSWLSAKMFSRTSKTNSETRSDLIGTLAPILLVNLLFSANPLSTLSWSLHFLLYLLFFLSLPKIYLLKSISYVLPLTLLFQLALSFTQVYLGHSIGGLMYYLGERSIAVGQPAVALGSFMDSVVLRAYGTFGHPNVLAGWSIISLLILLRLKSNIYLLASATATTAMMVMLAQSRSALITLFGLVIPFYLIKKLKVRLVYFAIVLSSLFSLLSPTQILSPSRAELSLSQRLDLQGLSWKVVSRYPIFGTGAQASISTYPSLAPGNRLLQPDHNSFTLFLSWFGLLGVLALLYSLRLLLSPSIHLLSPLLPLLALDHYFLTSPQGLFIFLLYLKLKYSHAQKNL